MIFDRTRIRHSRPPRSKSFRRCKATVYICVFDGCTETRYIPCRRSQNKLVDRRLETRSSVPTSEKCSVEFHRRPCTANMYLGFHGLYNKTPKFYFKNNVVVTNIFYVFYFSIKHVFNVFLFYVCFLFKKKHL